MTHTINRVKHGFLIGIIVVSAYLMFQAVSLFLFDSASGDPPGLKNDLNIIEGLIDSADYESADRVMNQIDEYYVPHYKFENDTYTKLLYLKARILYGQKNYNDAQEYMERAEAFIDKADAPHERKIVLGLSKLYRRNDEPILERQILQKYIARHPLDTSFLASLHLYLGTSLIQRGELESGMSVVGEARIFAEKSNDHESITRSKTLLIENDSTLTASDKVKALYSVYHDIPDELHSLKWKTICIIGDLYYFDMQDYKNNYETLLVQHDLIKELREGYNKERLLGITYSNLADGAYIIGLKNKAVEWIDLAFAKIDFMDRRWMKDVYETKALVYEYSKEETNKLYAELSAFYSENWDKSAARQKKQLEAKNQARIDVISQTAQARIERVEAYRLFLTTCIVMLFLVIGFIAMLVKRRETRRKYRMNMEKMHTSMLTGVAPDVLDGYVSYIAKNYENTDPQVSDILRKSHNAMKYQASEKGKVKNAFIDEVQSARLYLDRIRAMEHNDDFSYEINIDNELSDRSGKINTPIYLIEAIAKLAVDVREKGRVSMTLTRESNKFLRLSTMCFSSSNPLSSKFWNPINSILEHYGSDEICVKHTDEKMLIYVKIPLVK